MIRFRRLIDKLFMVNRPKAATWDAWAKWEDNFKKTRPITHFITNHLSLAKAWISKQTIMRVHDLTIYYSNRFVTQTHQLEATSLKKGKMHELSDRMLHCNFDAYVKWCETEASVCRLWVDETFKKYNLPWYARTWLSSFITIRSPQCAIDHLKWEMTLFNPDDGSSDPPSPVQAKIAYEKMMLYVWWTEIRPKRVDSWERSGLREYWDNMDKKYGSDWFWPGIANSKVLDQSEIDMYNKLSAAQADADEAQKNEDQEMLIRLIKIRDSLWT